MKLNGYVFGALLCAVLAIGCSAEQFGDVITLDARSGSARRTVGATDVAQEFLLLPFSAPSGGSASGAEDYTLTVTFSEKPTENVTPTSTTNRQLTTDLSRISSRVQAEEIRHQRSHEILSRTYAKFRQNPAPFLNFYANRSPRLAQTSVTPPENLTIFSPFGDEKNTEITGILRGYSNQAAIYVDSRANETMDDSVMAQILDDLTNITLPRTRTLFGEPSDVDGNGRVLVYFAPLELIGDVELGFFRPSDILPDGFMDDLRSNEMEIVFCRVPGLDIQRNLINATIAHEMFHLINFSEKSLPLFNQSGESFLLVEETFLNEGLAHLAEEITGWGVDTALITKRYFDCFNATSLAGSGTSNSLGSTGGVCDVVSSRDDSIPRRGGMMLFLLYIFQQLGGATYSGTVAGDVVGEGISFLKSLNTSKEVGISNLEKASKRNFFSWYKDFLAAISLDNRSGVSSDPRFRFASEVADRFTNLSRNVRTHSERTAANGALFNLTGPSPIGELAPNETKTIEESHSLFVSGAHAFRLVLPPNQEMDVSISAEDSLSLALNLIKLP